MAVRRCPRCRAQATAGAAAAPSVLAPSRGASRTDGAAATVKLARPPRHDIGRVRMIVLFQSIPYWPSETTYRPKARRSTTEMPAFSRFGTQQLYLGCYINTTPGGPSTP